ncbi:hypothetical protein [Pedobacter gandavensis]|uniref:hypothetical protein n=1 Tax=Pedobacter gandavensis TaxID=2679963 RepID=UPI00292D9A7F|nr:hypothetical protein [Pedobacter gandavensis]
MSAIIGLEESSFSKYHLLNLDSFGYYRSYWYSSIFIVIEGYTDLKIKNEEIDKLLENKVFVDQLRLFRNATFHYQKDLYNAKFTGIDDSNEFITWINKLHKLFGDCILNEMHKLVSPEVSEAIKANFDRILKGETKPD